MVALRRFAEADSPQLSYGPCSARTPQCEEGHVLQWTPAPVHVIRRDAAYDALRANLCEAMMQSFTWTVSTCMRGNVNSDDITVLLVSLYYTLSCRELSHVATARANRGAHALPAHNRQTFAASAALWVT